MRKIYTRTGDNGTTSLHGGDRVAKTDLHIEASGALDELNVAIGIARAHIKEDSVLQEVLKETQLTLMTVMSRVSTLSCKRCDNPNKLPDNLIYNIESILDDFTSKCDDTRHFILPGGTPASAFLQQARVSARKAERRLWALDAAEPVEPEILTYVNRLSDLFFILARYELQNAGLTEERWKLFSYNRIKQ